MKSVATDEFRDRLGRLPGPVRQQASRMLSGGSTRTIQAYSSSGSARQPVYSARVGLGHRALGLWEGDTITWLWMGSHAEYDALLARP